MQELSPNQRTPEIIDQLVNVWEKSVSATHIFLSKAEITQIKMYVPQALKTVPHLIIETNEQQKPIAFMGISERKLEMLFLAPNERGKGLGRKLLEYGIKNYHLEELVVNEQNPVPLHFYEHLGSEVISRFETDEQGNPYPILHMAR